MAIIDAKGQEYFARYPEGPADYTNPAYAAAVTIEARNSLNVFEFATAAGDITITLATTFTLQPQSVAKKIERFVGDIIVLYITDDGSADDIIFGTGITGADITITAGKTQMVTLMYISSTVGYVVQSSQQID